MSVEIDFMGASPYLKDYISKRSRRFMIGIIYLNNRANGRCLANLAEAVAMYFEVSRRTVIRCGSLIPDEYKKIFGVRENVRTEKAIAASKRNHERSNEKKRLNKIRALHYKGNACVKCGLKFDGHNACIFDFHHTDPSKKESALGALFYRSFENVIAELDKTELMCRNCHTMHHFGGV